MTARLRSSALQHQAKHRESCRCGRNVCAANLTRLECLKSKGHWHCARNACMSRIRVMLKSEATGTSRHPQMRITPGRAQISWCAAARSSLLEQRLCPTGSAERRASPRSKMHQGPQLQTVSLSSSLRRLRLGGRVVAGSARRTASLCDQTLHSYKGNAQRTDRAHRKVDVP